MPYYSYSELVAESQYIVQHYEQIKETDLQYMSEKRDHEFELILDVLKHHDFNYLIEPIEPYFPKTYHYLKSLNIQFQAAIQRRYDAFGEEEFSFHPFFIIAERVYWITLPYSHLKTLPDYIYKGWGQRLGGVQCTADPIPTRGKGCINWFSDWLSFDRYLLYRGKKKITQSLVERIPYVFEEDKEEGDHIPLNPKATKGFPNLRCIIDPRIPDENSKEFDLILMCYEYNSNVYWLKDRDCENGLFELENPQQVFDEYLYHFFSQNPERFDFSPWAKPIILTEEASIRIENMDPDEDSKDDKFRGISISDPELAAKLGHIPNQIRLGFCYNFGLDGFEQDIDRGHHWFWQAAKQGDKLAEYHWASYWCDQPVYVIENLTSKLLKKIHKANNLAATYMLGVYAESGFDGINQSYTKAVKYYKHAADLGFPPALNNLADKYENGLGVKKDLNRAYELYMQAAQFNIAAAQWSLALMYQNGTGVAKNEEQSIQWLKRAAQNGWDQADDILNSKDH